MPSSTQPKAVFSLDLGSPYAYLAAERIDDVLPSARWETLLLGGIFQATGRGSWGTHEHSRELGQREVERRAMQLGLPPVRWPQPWPNDGLLAARAAVWAASQQAERAFAQAALRLQFQDGVAISDPGAVAEALRRAGLDPEAGLAGAGEPAVKAELRRRTDAAVARGVFGVPSFTVGQFVLWGDDQLEVAAQLAAAEGSAPDGRAAAGSATDSRGPAGESATEPATPPGLQ